MNLRSLADLKRTLRVGTRLRCIENTYRPQLNGKKRIVTRLQTNGFWWKHEGEGEGERASWTEYPKAAQFTFDGSARFSFRLPLAAGERVVLEVLNG